MNGRLMDCSSSRLDAGEPDELFLKAVCEVICTFGEFAAATLL